jgi:hypothetical protein
MAAVAGGDTVEVGMAGRAREGGRWALLNRRSGPLLAKGPKARETGGF